MSSRWITLVLLVLPLAARGAEPAGKPNVLMICVDDLRPQLGCYGDPTVKSPNIDRLAARGLVFDRVYCQMALCSPSRISLLSGRRPATSGIYEIGPTLRSKMPDITTLPQHFKNQGYFTQSLGKVYHVGIDDPASWSVPSRQAKKPRQGPVGQELVRKRVAELKAAGKDPATTKGKDAPFMAGPTFESVDCEDDDLLDGDAAREGCELLRGLAQKANDQPFFLAVGFANPHVPWVAPKKYFDLYDPAQLPMARNNFVPRNAPPFAATSGADFFWYATSPKDGKVTPEFGRQCLHAYLAAISYIDAQVGRLIATLDESGVASNTIVLLWGDHGYYMGEHSWWGGKHNNYDGATRVPLIIVAPGMKAVGQHTSALAEFVDLYPTLSELAGLPKPDGVEGTSLRPLLDDPRRGVKTAAFSQYPKGSNLLGTAMRTDRHRYVEWRDRSTGELKATELYDHATDPEENENVAGNPENATVLAELAARMQGGWKAAVIR